VRHLRGEVVVDRTAAARLRLAQHLPELGEHLPQLVDVERATAGHTGHTRYGAEAERILRLVPTLRPVTVVVTVAGAEPERHITHTPTVRG
jgi:hypothetical protein